MSLMVIEPFATYASLADVDAAEYLSGFGGVITGEVMRGAPCVAIQIGAEAVFQFGNGEVPLPSDDRIFLNGTVLKLGDTNGDLVKMHQTDALKFRLECQVNGSIRLYDTTGLIDTSAPGVLTAASGPQRIEFSVDTIVGGAYEVLIAGVSVLSGTGDFDGSITTLNLCDSGFVVCWQNVVIYDGNVGGADPNDTFITDDHVGEIRWKVSRPLDSTVRSDWTEIGAGTSAGDRLDDPLGATNDGDTTAMEDASSGSDQETAWAVDLMASSGAWLATAHLIEWKWDGVGARVVNATTAAAASAHKKLGAVLGDTSGTYALLQRKQFEQRGSASAPTVATLDAEASGAIST